MKRAFALSENESESELGKNGKVLVYDGVNVETYLDVEGVLWLKLDDVAQAIFFTNPSEVIKWQNPEGVMQFQEIKFGIRRVIPNDIWGKMWDTCAHNSDDVITKPPAETEFGSMCGLTRCLVSVLKWLEQKDLGDHRERVSAFLQWFMKLFRKLNRFLHGLLPKDAKRIRRDGEIEERRQHHQLSLHSMLDAERRRGRALEEELENLQQELKNKLEEMAKLTQEWIQDEAKREEKKKIIDIKNEQKRRKRLKMQKLNKEKLHDQDRTISKLKQELENRNQELEKRNQELEKIIQERIQQDEAREAKRKEKRHAINRKNEQKREKNVEKRKRNKAKLHDQDRTISKLKQELENRNQELEKRNQELEKRIQDEANRQASELELVNLLFSGDAGDTKTMECEQEPEKRQPEGTDEEKRKEERPRYEQVGYIATTSSNALKNLFKVGGTRSAKNLKGRNSNYNGMAGKDDPAKMVHFVDVEDHRLFESEFGSLLNEFRDKPDSKTKEMYRLNYPVLKSLFDTVAKICHIKSDVKEKATKAINEGAMSGEPVDPEELLLNGRDPVFNLVTKKADWSHMLDFEERKDDLRPKLRVYVDRISASTSSGTPQPIIIGRADFTEFLNTEVGLKFNKMQMWHVLKKLTEESEFQSLKLQYSQ